MAALPPVVITYAERGWMLTPLRRNSKVPILDNWPSLNRTSNLEQLEKWSSENPGCNWGLVTGSASGVWVLDVDTKNGKQGLEWQNQQSLQHGVEWLDTLRVRTASGGYHNYYLWSEGIGKSTDGQVSNGVDVIGEGGQVVVPGSVINGVPYQFEGCDAEKDILPSPQWLLPDILKKPEEKKPPRANGEGKIPAGTGERHQFLLHHAGQLLHCGVSFTGLLAELLEVNRRKFQEPYSQDEVYRQAQDFFERWQRDPSDIWREFRQSYRREKAGKIPSPSSFEIADQILKEVKRMSIDWLPGWEPYIAMGTLTMLTGDPGVGKSYIALAIAAGLTQKGFNVAYLSVENPAAQVVGPRFDALGGDSGRVVLIKGLVTPDGKRSITLQDLYAFDTVIQRHDIKLVIIDPIQSYLGAHVDAYRSNETRPVLDGLVELAERHALAMLILRHVVKAGGGRAIHKGLGSIDFTGAVRSELFAGETVDKKQRAMVHIKSNLGYLGKTMGYEIVQGDEFGHVWQAGYFRWTGECELRVSDLTEPESARADDSALKEAEDFLTTALSTGAKLESEIREDAKTVDIRPRTLRRAKKKLHIQSHKRPGDRKWEWMLPSKEAKDVHT